MTMSIVYFSCVYAAFLGQFDRLSNPDIQYILKENNFIHDRKTMVNDRVCEIRGLAGLSTSNTFINKFIFYTFINMSYNLKESKN